MDLRTRGVAWRRSEAEADTASRLVALAPQMDSKPSELRSAQRLSGRQERR